MSTSDDLIFRLYPVVIAFAFGAAFLSGRFGSIVAWLVLGSVAWVFGALEAATARGASDAGQAALLIFVALPACLPIAAAAWFGRWLHRRQLAR
jgi:hypothetical protein